VAAPVIYRKYKNDEEKTKVYNHRLAVSDKDFESWEAEAKKWWDRYENLPQKRQASRKGLVVNVPTAVAVIDALFSGMTAVDVAFRCTPTGDTTPEQAILAETALNYEWRVNRVDEDRDDAIKDALITGIGWVKVGYEYLADEVEVDRDEDEIAADIDQLLAEAEASGVETPSAEQIAQLVPTTKKVEVPIRDRIVVDYVPWDRVRFDPTARRFKDVRWIAQLTPMTVEEVKNNPQWREYVKRTRGGLDRLERLQADAAIDKDLWVGDKPTDDDKRVTVVEMWDLEAGTYCIFVRGQNWLLYEGVNPFAMMPELQDRSPFVPIVLRKTTRRVRGISEMDVMLRSLREKDLYRSMAATYIERIVPKLIGPEDALTDEGKEALSNAEVGAYVSISRDVDPRTIQPLIPPPLPEKAFDMENKIDNEIREATGVNELMRGLFPDRRRTATETAEVVAASAARQSEKRNTLERFHVDIARRMLALMMQFYDQPRVVRLVDPSLGNVPWEFTADDIAGEFLVSVSLEPREAPTKESIRTEATVALNVLGPYASPQADGTVIIDPTSLLTWWMRKYGFSEYDINELLNSQEEQQAKQAEAIGLMAASRAAAQGVDQLQMAGLPPDLAAAAVASQGAPLTPEAAKLVSENRGVAPGP
jgi:hypothetical protein